MFTAIRLFNSRTSTLTEGNKKYDRLQATVDTISANEFSIRREALASDEKNSPERLRE